MDTNLTRFRVEIKLCLVGDQSLLQCCTKPWTSVKGADLFSQIEMFLLFSLIISTVKDLREIFKCSINSFCEAYLRPIMSNLVIVRSIIIERT